MSFRAFHAAATVAVVFTVSAPAQAQQFSDSYQFLEAIRKEDGSKVEELLKKPGLSVNTKDRSTGEGALHILVRNGRAASLVFMRFLLQRDANPDIQDREGNTPLMLAVNTNFIEAVQALITYKADINLGNSSGETPLIRAVQLRNPTAVELLLKHGADPDRADLLAGMSARDYARDVRSPRIQKMLADAPKLQPRGTAGPKL